MPTTLQASHVMPHEKNIEVRSPGAGANKMSPEVVEKAIDFVSAAAFEHQIRTRRLFSASQLFAFSLTYMAVWEGMCTNMYFALYNGGPSAFVFSIIIVFFGACSQAASIGEVASIQPVAGAQYHFT